jgi:pimeloyl-ACP methyl ester carboxylesterase
LAALGAVLCHLALAFGPTGANALPGAAQDTLTVAVGDIDVAYRIAGAGEPLLMIMGFGGTMDAWDPALLDALAANYQVITFDNRGMGGTTAAPGPFSIPQLADDTAWLLDALGIERAHVLGFSMGGFIAQELALQHPERVESLVLLATSCGGAEAAPISRDVQRVLADTSGTAAERVARLLPFMLPESWLAEHESYARAILFRQRIPVDSANLRRQGEAILVWPGSCDRLAELGHRTLVLAGDADAMMPPANAQILAERIPGASLTHFADGGHFLMMQFPEDLARTIHQFLAAQ